MGQIFGAMYQSTSDFEINLAKVYLKTEFQTSSLSQNQKYNFKFISKSTIKFQIYLKIENTSSNLSQNQV